jgi:hypothetical protein
MRWEIRRRAAIGSKKSLIELNFDHDVRRMSAHRSRQSVGGPNATYEDHRWVVSFYIAGQRSHGAKNNH